MKRTVKILVITAAALIVTGCISAGAGMLSGGLDYVKMTDLGHMTGKWTFTEITKTRLDPFTSAEINLSASDIRILPSDDENAYISGADYTKDGELPYHFSVSDGTLHLDDSGIYNTGWFHIEIYNILTSGNDDTDKQRGVTLYLPKDLILKELNVNSSAGETDLSQIHALSLAIHIDSGDLTAKDCVIEKGQVTSSSGNIRTTTSTLNDCTFNLDSGDFTDSHSLFGGSARVETGFGNISFKMSPSAFDKMSVTVQLGNGEIETEGKTESSKFGKYCGRLSDDISDMNYVPEGPQGGSLHIKSDMGDVSFILK